MRIFSDPRYATLGLRYVELARATERSSKSVRTSMYMYSESELTFRIYLLEK